MSDDPHDFKPLTRMQKLQRWLEVQNGYEFLCHTCNAADLAEEGEGGGGCIGMCRLTNKERAKEYQGGSDAYVPRHRYRWLLGG